MIIRPAEKKDYASIMVLYQQLQPDDPVVEESKGRPVFENVIESESNFLLVAEIASLIWSKKKSTESLRNGRFKILKAKN